MQTLFATPTQETPGPHAENGAEVYRELLRQARAAAQQDRPHRAGALCREAIRVDPLKPTAFAMLALALAEQDRLDEAARAAAEARQRARGDRNIVNLEASLALRRGRAEEGVELSLGALALDPNDPRALSDLAQGLRQSNRHAEAARFAEPGRLIASTHPALPSGFGSVDAFNAALTEIIVAGYLRRPDPRMAMVGGRRLNGLFEIEAPLIAGWRDVLLNEAGAYPAALAVPPDHPVIAGRPRCMSMRGWANVVGPGQFERPHIHEAGWLSGVYYVETPPTGGDILFGGHHHVGLAGAEPTLRIRPQAGQLLVFPSYLHHGTEPFTGEGRRISVAFDVMREG